MRLGQLARKLDIKQSDIISKIQNEFDITLENGPNTKIENEHVEFLESLFNPKKVEEFSESTINPSELSDDQQTDTTDNQIIEEISLSVSDPIENNDLPKQKILIDGVVQEVELIKAPKIELSGPKVLGKIELPEKKVEEIIEGKEADKEIAQKAIAPKKYDKKKESRKPRREFELTTDDLERRERKRKEAEQREKEERAKREKEKKKLHYDQLMAGKPENAIRKPRKKEVEIKETVSAIEDIKEIEVPKSIFGKFWHWLNNAN